MYVYVSVCVCIVYVCIYTRIYFTNEYIRSSRNQQCFPLISFSSLYSKQSSPRLVGDLLVVQQTQRQCWFVLPHDFMQRDHVLRSKVMVEHA